MARQVAFVTGASRGIGKACAVHLAGAGFDVALTARTVHEGEAREHSSTVQRSDTRPLPGSLTATAAAVRATGQEVHLRAGDCVVQNGTRHAWHNRSSEPVIVAVALVGARRVP